MSRHRSRVNGLIGYVLMLCFALTSLEYAFRFCGQISVAGSIPFDPAQLLRGIAKMI